MQFYGIEALYAIDIVPTDKLSIQDFDSRTQLFKQEEFKCPKFEGAHHCPKDEVDFFARLIPRVIPD